MQDRGIVMRLQAIRDAKSIPKSPLFRAAMSAIFLLAPPPRARYIPLMSENAAAIAAIDKLVRVEPLSTRTRENPFDGCSITEILSAQDLAVKAVRLSRGIHTITPNKFYAQG